MNITSNIGQLVRNKKGTLRHYGKVWFSAQAIKNILSLGRWSETYRVTYVSVEEESFNIHKEDRILKFVCNEQDL